MKRASMVLLAVVLAGCWGNRSDVPPIHLQQNMDFQERGEAQEKVPVAPDSPLYNDGRWMRPAPKGTVAVGHLKEDDHYWRGRSPDGTLADALPPGVELDEALLDRGQERFNIYCQPCHGEMGYGDGPVTRRGGGFQVKPANFHTKKLAPAPLGYLFHVVSWGASSMQGYASQIPVRDRWAIAAWVRTLQVAHRADAGSFPNDAPLRKAVHQ